MTFVIKAILENEEGVCFYTSAHSIRHIFEKIKELLFYYNKNIASTWFHPTLKLLRFFQMQDKNCSNDTKPCASLDMGTIAMMSKWHLDKLESKQSSITEGIISLEKGAIKDSIKVASKIITINLNTNTIDLIGCFKTISRDDYLKKNNKDDFLWEEVPEIPFELDNIQANEIDELWEFVEEHNNFKKKGYLVLLAPFTI